MCQQLKELDAQSILLTGLRRVETSDHSIYIRTVISFQLLSAKLNWFKLVYVQLCQSKMDRTLNFSPDQPGKNQKYQSYIVAKVIKLVHVRFVHNFVR